MNLFVIGWHLPKEWHSTAWAELRRMSGLYPHLDPETLWHRSSPCGTVFMASLHTADRLASPRRYVVHTGGHTVSYSGLPIDPAGVHAAHDAEVLSARWDQLAKGLEGQYCVVRATDDPLRLELMIDLLGMEHVFYRHDGDAWLVSNSVQLLERISGPSSLDPLGVSLFLTGNELAADRTLRRDIQIIPGGQHWIWEEGDIAPTRQSYFDRSRLARQPRRALSPSDYRRLADDLTQICCSVSRSFGELRCPLTGGRDSRLLAALLVHAGLPAQYYTAGDPSCSDVRIGTLVAQTYNLTHQVDTITAPEVLDKWDELCWQFVRQNEGMSSLWEIATALDLSAPIERLRVGLWGMGGEIGRGRYNDPCLFLGKHDVEAVQRYLVGKRISSCGGLVRPEAVELAKDYVRHYVTQCVDEGWQPIDVPDVFFAFERVGRFGGVGARRVMAIGDAFAPLCSRPFVEATFAMPPLHRLTEPLHYNLIRLLAPELHELPCDKGPWRSQQPVLNLLRLRGASLSHDARSMVGRRVPRTLRRLKRRKPSEQPRAFDRSNWLEVKREQVREVCLDQAESLLWGLVDRSVFERMMSVDADPMERYSHRGALYDIATVFYYEADHQRHALPATQT